MRLMLAIMVVWLVAACYPPERQRCIEWKGEGYHARECTKWESLSR